jgi:hypothetical protein
MAEGLDAFAGAAYLSETDITNLRSAHQASVSSFGAHVDLIVEALGFAESELNSAFARDNQTAYEALLDTAQQSEMSDNRFIRPVVREARTLWKKYQGGQVKL